MLHDDLPWTNTIHQIVQMLVDAMKYSVVAFFLDQKMVTPPRVLRDRTQVGTTFLTHPDAKSPLQQ